MSDNNQVNPNGKIVFGVDYLIIMRWMEEPADDEVIDLDKALVTDAIMRLFLLQWDFSVEEIDEANRIYWERVKSNTLFNKLGDVLDRVVNFLKDDKKAQEKLIIELIAVANMDNKVTKDEKSIPQYFSQQFDLRPTEYNKLIDKGIDWSTAVNFVGNEYIKYDKAKNNK